MSLYKRFKAFLDKAFRLIPHSEEATALRDEMLDSLMSKANEYRDSGRSDDDVFSIAVDALGDYASAINSLKRHPLNVIRDPGFQRRVLLKISVVLLAVTVYLVFSAVFDMWGTLALIIFPTLAAALYIWSTAEVLYRNFKFHRHATSGLIISGYAVIFMTALFFILWAGARVPAKYAWLAFSYLPLCFSVINIVSRKVLRGKRITYFHWCSVVMTACVAAFLTSAMITGLWHPLWIITILGVVVCGFLGVVKLSAKIRTQDNR